MVSVEAPLGKVEVSVGEVCEEAWWVEHDRATRNDWKEKFEMLEGFCLAQGYKFRWIRGANGWEAEPTAWPANAR